MHRPGRIFPGQKLTDPGLEIGVSLQAGDVSCFAVSVASPVVVDLGEDHFVHISPLVARPWESLYYLASHVSSV